VIGRGRKTGSILKSGAKDAEVLRLIHSVLEEGTPVVIEGVGTFHLSAESEVEFQPVAALRVFIAYASEDEQPAGRLYAALKRRGFSPWRDKEELLPGQNWPRAIERAIELSDFFIACLSKNSIMKRGYFQSELRFAIDVARLVPADEVFVIPVRLDKCPMPAVIGDKTHYVDLFSDWDKGIEIVTRTMLRRANRRQQRLELAS
jgi:hypothetical protein